MSGCHEAMSPRHPMHHNDLVHNISPKEDEDLPMELSYLSDSEGGKHSESLS